MPNEQTRDHLAPLRELIGAGASIIAADTKDLLWIQELIVDLGRELKRSPRRWSLANGLVTLPNGLGKNINLRKPADLIRSLAAMPDPSIVMLADIAMKFDDDETISALRDFASQRSPNHHVLILPLVGETLPIELRPLTSYFDPGLPDSDDFIEVIETSAAEWGGLNQQSVVAKREPMEQLARSLMGLTRSEARMIIRVAIADGILDEDDIPAAISAKHKLLTQAGALSFYPETENMANVAGLSVLKEWLALRKDYFSAEEIPAGRSRPKGCLLLGVQGGGKSLAAKAIAGSWGVALLSLDMAALYNKYHGETERNLREALRAADVMQPCVLWIDEIEKGLASDDSDGLSQRVLGTLLTWMNERKSRVFLVATANNIEKLPPELLRKGRFDEIFFVDLPSASVRSVILEIHLKKRGFAAEDFDLAMLAETAAGFTGAELEQCIEDAMFTADDAATALASEHIKTAIENTSPLSIVRFESLAKLRAWAASRTVLADAGDTDHEPEASESEGSSSLI